MQSATLCFVLLVILGLVASSAYAVFGGMVDFIMILAMLLVLMRAVDLLLKRVARAKAKVRRVFLAEKIR